MIMLNSILKKKTPNIIKNVKERVFYPIVKIGNYPLK
jgi:hypothetical protein